MAGGRRNAKSSSFKHHGHSDDRHELPPHPQAVQPKHIPVPEIPCPSELGFEAEAMVLALFAMAGQYINLYKSVFWLPYSHTEYALNYYLIDYYIMTINIIMIGRRLPACILKKLCSMCFSPCHQALYMLCINIVTATVLIPVLLFCFFNVIKEYGLWSSGVFLYPIALQGVVLGPSHFLKLTRETVGHQCSQQAEAIRVEVDRMRADFNLRWKQVLFNCTIVVYHATLVPCYFAQATMWQKNGILHFDEKKVYMHAFWTGAGCVTLYTTHFFPPRYCDTLHRAALHLGRWQKVEPRNVPYSTWSGTAMWNQGALVKHSKEMFKAEGISNAAIPGDSGHSKFHWVFKNPAAPTQVLWMLQIMLLLGEVMALIQSHAWHELVSLQLLVLVNCRTLYSTTRIHFVLKRIYHEERTLIAKFTS